ncbi:fibronectin type III domain-containing protein [Leptospira wolffii]|uniref:fibronectin type III domain-containing protein n=1 Tax=Leptospira wolffii TaxID=409998 RepID=UPI001084684B|nr:fibronectin type III domain-containing protein [Leptospira wolffii]TGK62540.1 fibronectin type III domain-containing protein [Leptospira wolffii]TGK70392.1 fibronectin type III domain-containing protein [Leptospira wolffii]TGK74075.1 fibronectin type III domain-containing protein [Leptospira wolffii]TGL28934.1 fibronectin type III domain-containing protein [Leptospira wolffii]
MARPSERIHRIVLSIILIFLPFTSEIFAEGKTFIYYIEWKEVKGSRGYVVEVRKNEPPQDMILEKKVLENEIEFRLDAGTYEYRIAALNRFGKPSSYTQWTLFKVEQDRPKAVALAEKQEAAPKSKSSFVWIPGTGFYSKDEKWKAYGVWFWLGTLAYLGNSEREAGNRLASKPLNDPANLGLLAIQIPTPLTFYLWQARAGDKQEYDQHQNNQAIIGGLALLSVIGSLWWENKLPAGDAIYVRMKPDTSGLIQATSNLGVSQSRWEIQYTRSF